MRGEIGTVVCDADCRVTWPIVRKGRGTESRCVCVAICILDCSMVEMIDLLLVATSLPQITAGTTEKSVVISTDFGTNEMWRI